MTVFWKIAGLCLLMPFLFSLIKIWNPSFEGMLRVGAAVVLGGLILSLWVPLWQQIAGFSEKAGCGEIGEKMLPILGVVLLSKAVGNTCRDCGAATLGNYVEYAGRLEVLVLCLPILNQIWQLVTSLMEI